MFIMRDYIIHTRTRYTICQTQGSPLGRVVLIFQIPGARLLLVQKGEHIPMICTGISYRYQLHGTALVTLYASYVWYEVRLCACVHRCIVGVNVLIM